VSSFSLFISHSVSCFTLKVEVSHEFVPLVDKTGGPLGELQLVLEDKVLNDKSLDAYGHLRGSSPLSPSSDALRFC
jgi:hypothetical protein